MASDSRRSDLDPNLPGVAIPNNSGLTDSCDSNILSRILILSSRYFVSELFAGMASNDGLPSIPFDQPNKNLLALDDPVNFVLISSYALSISASVGIPVAKFNKN